MKKLIFNNVIIFFIIAISLNVKANINVTGTSGGTLDGTYTSFTNAGGVFQTLNTGGSQFGRSITIIITDDVTNETGSNSLNPGLWTSITIIPNGARVLSGSVASPLINFSGSDYVIIDGLNSSGNSLTISNLSNSNIANTSTIRFISGASNNIIRNCNILGSSQNALGMPGGTIFFYTGGNNNNLISNCNIGPASTSLPFKAIYSLSNLVTINKDNIIDNNNIFDFFGSGTGSTAGIYILSGNDNWIISNNNFYQTDVREFTLRSLRYSGIILNTLDIPGKFTVSGNNIGFGNSNQTGTTLISGLYCQFRGIDAISVSSAKVTNIFNNTISGISHTTKNTYSSFDSISFIGIAIGKTEGLVNVNYNFIGSVDGSSEIIITETNSELIAATRTFIGILNTSTSNSNISNNNISYITIQGSGNRAGFRGISIFTDTSQNSIINNNVISNITNLQIGIYDIYGIVSNGPKITISDNIIRDITANAGHLYSVDAIKAIYVISGSNNNLIEKNKIYNLKNTCSGLNSSANIIGIDANLRGSNNEIKQNYIFAISPYSESGFYIVGIVRQTQGNINIHNNMISLGIHIDGSPITIGCQITGILDAGWFGSETVNYYYNSVYIGGSGVDVSTYNSIAFRSLEENNTRNFQNNIFWNDRSNLIPGGAFHAAINVAGSGIDPAGLNCNLNNLYASGTDGIVGFYDGVKRVTLEDWKSATGQDMNSSSVPVDFRNIVTGELHLDGASNGNEDLLGIPIPVITIDIDGDLRDVDYPYMGAHEADILLPVEITSFYSEINGRDVTLNWVTSSEINNSGFNVERSAGNEKWSISGFINGKGYSTTPQNYLFTDRNLSTGIYKYRLKQLDNNGNFEYFYLNNDVKIGVPDKYELFQNYPNPFNPSTSINFSIPSLSKVSIKLFDMTGREVLVILNEEKAAGFYTIKVAGKNLPSGIYLYSIVAEEKGNFFSATKKMTLLK